MYVTQAVIAAQPPAALPALRLEIDAIPFRVDAALTSFLGRLARAQRVCLSLRRVAGTGTSIPGRRVAEQKFADSVISESNSRNSCSSIRPGGEGLLLRHGHKHTHTHTYK